MSYLQILLAAFASACSTTSSVPSGEEEVGHDSGSEDRGGEDVSEDSATETGDTDTDTAGEETGSEDSGFDTAVDLPVDADADGFTEDIDCDDTNAAINPGATEVCDSVDNDCDSDIDEAVNTWWYADADADGYGTVDTRWAGCPEGPPPIEGYVLDSSDCDDTNASVYPDAAEVCSNSIDDNCDDRVDENCEVGTAACQFTVNMWDEDRTGPDDEEYPESMYEDVVMGNELVVTKSTASPSGAAVPGYIEIFRVDFTAVHTTCTDITVSGAQLSSFVMDNAMTGWYEDLFQVNGFSQVNLTTGDVIGANIVQGSGRYGTFYATAYLNLNEFVIPAGRTYSIAWYADTTGASTLDDDTIDMDIEPDSMGWTDGTTAGYMILARLEGGTLIF